MTQQLDDDYFRRALVTRIEAGGSSSVAPLVQNVLRAVVRPESRNFSMDWLRSFSKIDLHSEAGIYLGEEYVQRVDAKRLCAVVERITKGLYYKRYNNRLPDSHMVKVIPLDCLASADPDLRAVALRYVDYVLTGTHEAVGADAFDYWVNAPVPLTPQATSRETFWFHLFYRSTAFLAGTHSKSLISGESNS